MEIRLSKSDLAKVLGLAYRAIPAKTTTPILEGFLMNHSDGVLRVTASDMELTIVAKVSCEGSTGKACLPAKTLVDLVKTLPDTEISLAAENGRVKVDWGKGNSEFPALEVADYPEIKGVEGNQTSVSGDDLKAAIRHTLPNAADDTLRPCLNGLYFDPDGDKVNIVASDTHTLAFYPIDGKVESPFVLPSKAAAFIKDSICCERVGISFKDNTVMFDLDGVEVYSRTIIGKFPNYKAIFPQSCGSEIKGDLDTLRSAVARVSSCGNKASKSVKLSLDMLGSVIEAQDLGFNCSARESIDALAYNGEKMEIGFRYDLLLKLLSAFDGKKVTMSFTGANKAALVESEGNPCKAIIMPMQIK